MIDAVIFDMDGLLIDSEPFWQEAEVLVFGKIGVPLTKAMCVKTMGLRLNEVISYWHGIYPWDLKKHPLKKVEKEIVHEVGCAIKTKGQALPGVYKVLKFLQKNKIKMALASSSNLVLINAVVEKLELASYFLKTNSAQFVSHGKPHPVIFLKTAQDLQVLPQNCLVFEDSLNGVIAAKAARMQCIAVPGIWQKNDPRFKIADAILDDLTQFNAKLMGKMNKLK